MMAIAVCLLSSVELVVSRRRGVHGFAVVGISCVPIIVASVPIIFHVAITVSISWATGATTVVEVPIPSITVSAFVFAGRVVSAARRGRAIAASWRRSIASLTRFTAVTAVTTLAATLATTAASSFIPPSSRWRSSSPLDLNHIVSTDALVMHLVVGIIGIAAALVLDKGEQPA
jgi:hypothetical protein